MMSGFHAADAFHSAKLQPPSLKLADAVQAAQRKSEFSFQKGYIWGDSGYFHWLFLTPLSPTDTFVFALRIWL